MSKPVLRLVLATVLVVACAVVSHRATADFTLVPGTVQAHPGPVSKQLCNLGGPCMFRGCNPVNQEVITYQGKNYIIQSALWQSDTGWGFCIGAQQPPGGPPNTCIHFPNPVECARVWA